MPLLTDMRLPMDTEVFRMLPGSTTSLHFTEDADNEGSALFKGMTLGRLIIFLADAITFLSQCLGLVRQTRSVIHELESLLIENLIDFFGLQKEPKFLCGLTNTISNLPLLLLKSK